MKTIKDKYLVVGADFAGFPLKEAVVEHLEKKGWKVTDVGVRADSDPNDTDLMFHRVGLRVGAMISEGEFERALLFCGTLLFISDRLPRRNKNEKTMTVKDALIIGAFQAIATVPGVSRSGATILGALLGYLLGEIGPLGLTLSLGFASGAMLYVVFGEILPQSILMYHSKLPAFSTIVGILVGLLIIFA